MPRSTRFVLFLVLTGATVSGNILHAAEQPAGRLRKADFASDPGWEGHRNRLVPDPAPVTRQDFGHRATNHARGKEPGEIGGWVQRSATPAFYGKVIPERTLNDRLRASGTFAVTRDRGSSGTMFGWFNKNSRGWRTPNSLVFRIDGNGDKYWVFFEYGTRNWLAGGHGCFEGECYQTTETKPFAADGTPHKWTLDYDPDAAGGRGEVVFVLDGTRYVLPLADGHKADGAVFDRFGILNQQNTGDGMEVWFDDLVLDGEPQDLKNDPKWDGRGNEVKYADRVRRPLHDVGFSPTKHAGGAQPGEIGGVIWRDYKLAYYGDKVGPLTLGDELSASGKVAFLRGASDSGVFFGWFNSESRRDDDEQNKSEKQRNFVGVLIEGPSRIGHYFRPIFRTDAGEGILPESGPVIRPDGKVHQWSIRYRPAQGGRLGRIVLTLDGETKEIEVPADRAREGATFDRFGIFTMKPDGGFVEFYLDDVEYTAAPER